MSLPVVSRDPIERAEQNRKYQESIEQQRSIWSAELSLMGKIALLKMNNSTLSRGVAARLIHDEAFDAHPSYSDYLDLGKLGLCERPEGGQWHEITMLGTARANTLTRSECKRLSIHVLQGGGLSGSGNCFHSCACGGWSYTGRAGSSTGSNVARSFGNHVATSKGVDGMVRALKPKAGEG